MQYLLLQQHLQQQQVQAAVAAVSWQTRTPRLPVLIQTFLIMRAQFALTRQSKMAQVGVSDSNLANAAAASLKFGSQIDARQFAMSNPLALYQQQLQQHMQLQAQQQQQHKDSETAAEKQQRLVLLQHQQFLVQQRMMHAHLMQQTVRVITDHHAISLITHLSVQS